MFFYVSLVSIKTKFQVGLLPGWQILTNGFCPIAVLNSVRYFRIELMGVGSWESGVGSRESGVRSQQLPMGKLNVPDKYDQRYTNSGNYRYTSISSRKKTVKPFPLLPCSPTVIIMEFKRRLAYVR